MLNIFICEDNKTQRNIIKRYIEKTITLENYDIDIKCSTENPYEILEYIKSQEQVGLCFLDIDLNNDIDGLLLAQNIRKYDPRGFIVFITTHSELAYFTFSYLVEAMDFIIKDKPNELYRRIQQCIADAYSKYSSPSNSIHPNFTLKLPGYELIVPYDDIVYFETSQSHTIVLHTSDSVVEFNGLLKNIFSSLDNRFFRCHRSYIINKDHIETIYPKKKIIVMDNGDTCILSSKLVKELLK